MGRYLRRSSRLASGGEVAVVEVVPPSVLGVRTRSKVQRHHHDHHHQQHNNNNNPVVEDAPTGSLSYLQLRSRRLDKGHCGGIGSSTPRRSRGEDGSTGRARGGSRCVEEDVYHNEYGQHCGVYSLDWGGATAGAAGEMSARGEEEEEKVRRMVAKAYAIMRWEEPSGDDEKGGKEEEEEEDNDDDDEEESVQASCGDDGGLLQQLEVVESRGERFSRETTPCSLILSSSDAVRMTPPGSSTRLRASRRLSKGGGGCDDASTAAVVVLATTREMEEFFAGAEQEQQRVFVDKYNFDVANECPLPGRYVWEKLGSSLSSW